MSPQGYRRTVVHVVRSQQLFGLITRTCTHEGQREKKKKIILTSFWMIFILRVEFARLASIQKNQSTSYKSRKVAYTSVLHMERQELRRTLKCTLTGTLPLVESQRNNDI